MKYLLDTDTCIYIINKKPQNVIERFHKADVGDIAISTVTQYELFYGAYKSRQSEKNRIAIHQFCLPLEILVFDENAADICGKNRAALEKKGNIIGALDLQIAAIALANNVTLVTNNTKEFRRITHLKLDNWIV